MSYKSDVRIITSKNGFKKLSEFVEKYLKEKNLDMKKCNLMNSLDINVSNKEQCYFGWDHIKWYDGYSEVDSIMRGLDNLVEEEYSYRYMQIGEYYDDIEEEYYDGDKEKDIYLEYPCIIREFDDDYVKDLIQDKEIEQMKEDKESMEI